MVSLHGKILIINGAKFYYKSYAKARKIYFQIINDMKKEK